MPGFGGIAWGGSYYGGGPPAPVVVPPFVPTCTPTTEAGYGTESYGVDPYGIGGYTPGSQITLLVQPYSDYVGNQLTIASAGCDLTDPSRNDKFNLSTPNTLLWNVFNTGVYNTSQNSGLVVELNKVVGGSSYTLSSKSEYISGDVSLTYDILSNFLADSPINEINYVTLEMQFDPSNKLSIGRRLLPGINGHHINVTYTKNGVYAGGANVLTKSGSDKIRLIRHGTVVAALYNDQVLLYNNTHQSNNFTVKVYSSTNSQNEYVKVKYKSYVSSTGIMVANTPMYSKMLETNERIVGIIPATTYVGVADVLSFNHWGLRGIADDAFEYPLVLMRTLSPNDGVMGNIQTDPILRD